jgi:hypothetical protein
MESRFGTSAKLSRCYGEREKQRRGGRASGPPPVVHGGPLAGVNTTPGAPDPYVLPSTPPTVFGDAFGQNGPLNGGSYGPYSWDYSHSYDPLVFTPQSNLGTQTYNQLFGIP